MFIITNIIIIIVVAVADDLIMSPCCGIVINALSNFNQLANAVCGFSHIRNWPVASRATAKSS